MIKCCQAEICLHNATIDLYGLCVPELVILPKRFRGVAFMDYNQFYKKRDQRKRKYSPSEKANLLKLVYFFLIMVFIGILAGAIIILLSR